MNLTTDNHGSVAVAAGQPSAALTLLRTGGIVLAGTALIAISAHVAVPLWFTPVPVTMQPFAVILLGLLLSPRVAFATMVAYLAEGAAGLPVFTPSGPGGLLQLFGPTGGYLLSYPVVAPLVSTLLRRGKTTFSTTFSRSVVAAGLGSLVTLGMGAIWFALFTHTPAWIVLSHAVLPFLPGDVLKVVLAAGAARFRKQNS
jgi:biotin transport system substrate-specific component